MTENNNAANSVVIERTLDAPAEFVWNMWTDPAHFQAWYGPDGATIPTANFDASVDGTRHVCMEMNTPNGPMQMWFVGQHREVVENTRLVYTESMSDEEGNIIDPSAMGMPEGHPVTEVIVELEEVDGKTKMVMRHVGVPAGSPGEAGWTMALDKLTAYISQVS